jgi:hypothetical protein
LDAISAHKVMNTVKKLALGRSVVCTIHQPSSEIINLFDYILLLQKGGKIAYFGPVKDLPSYCESAGLGTYKVGQNIADFALEVIRNSQNNQSDPSQTFLSSEKYHEVSEQVDSGIEKKNDADSSFIDSKLSKLAPFWKQVATLLQRNVNGNFRDTGLVGTRAGATLFIAFLVGTMFWRLPFDQVGANSRVAVFFATLTFPIFFANFEIPLMIASRPILSKTRHLCFVMLNFVQIENGFPECTMTQRFSSPSSSQMSLSTF